MEIPSSNQPKSQVLDPLDQLVNKANHLIRRDRADNVTVFRDDTSHAIDAVADRYTELPTLDGIDIAIDREIRARNRA